MARSGLKMVAVRYKYLVEDIDRHGNVRLYFRRKGFPKIRLRALPGTDEFQREYAAALSGRPLKIDDANWLPKTTDKHSLLWLCQRFMEKSPQFAALADNTRAVKRGVIERLCREPFSETNPKPIGFLPYRDLPASSIVRLRDRLAVKPEAANARVKALRQIFQWAVHLGYAEHNPARDVGLICRNSTGFETWTEKEIRQFLARHPAGSKARLALGILLYLGVRRSDAVTIGRQHIRTSDQLPPELAGLGCRFVAFKIFKGRGRRPSEHYLPILEPLEKILAASSLGDLTWLVTTHGKPFTAAGFGNWFRERCDEAGLGGYSAHGLRKAAATFAAENGASAHTLMAIFGWNTSRQSETYTRVASQKKLAAKGMSLLIDNRTVPLFEDACGGGTKKPKIANGNNT